MKLLTSEQQDVIDKLHETGAQHVGVDFTKYHGSNLSILINVHYPTDETRNLVVHLGSKVNKERLVVGDGDTIIGKTSICGMEVLVFDWGVCKVVGQRKVVKMVNVTDCELREHPELEAELVTT